PRRPRPHPASVWLPRRRAIDPGGAMSVLPRMGPMRFLRRPRGPRPITPGAPPSRRANAASTRPSRGDIFTEQLAGHFHWTATVEDGRTGGARGFYRRCADSGPRLPSSADTTDKAWRCAAWLVRVAAIGTPSIAAAAALLLVLESR